ncbi:MAG: Acg family FMN-binding oxidoreductase [Panacagrimonas sp.]
MFEFQVQVLAMPSRRQVILAATSVPFGLLGLQSCSSDTAGDPSYEEAAGKIWRRSESGVGDGPSLHHELVRYATLAPSSHNTQCWKFRSEDRAISVLPDLSRRCPAVDPDDHHLFVSLGCAVENMLHAALANGLKGDMSFDATADGALRVSLEPTRAVLSPLFEAIPRRQCTRAEFDRKPLSNEELNLLERAGTGTGVRVVLLTARESMEEVLEHVVHANSAQTSDPAFVAELKAWIRFSDDEAIRSGDGLSTRASGNPSVPRWLGSRLFKLLFTAGSENDKYAKHIRSSAGIAIFVSEANDKAHWIEAGRCYQRFALQAAALGIRNAFLNQPVEDSILRPQFASAFGMGGHRPDLVVRFGRGPEMPRSLRRTITAVLA